MKRRELNIGNIVQVGFNKVRVVHDEKVSCEYYPGDGVCIMIEEHVCPASIFFKLVEESENGMVEKNTYMKNCI